MTYEETYKTAIHLLTIGLVTVREFDAHCTTLLQTMCMNNHTPQDNAPYWCSHVHAVHGDDERYTDIKSFVAEK